MNALFDKADFYRAQADALYAAYAYHSAGINYKNALVILRAIELTFDLSDPARERLYASKGIIDMKLIQMAQLVTDMANGREGVQA